MEEKQFKSITEELCYLRKEIENLNEMLKEFRIEYHYHYTIDYRALVEIFRERGYIE